jgi:hypothetical protein
LEKNTADANGDARCEDLEIAMFVIGLCRELRAVVLSIVCDDGAEDVSMLPD